MLIHGPLRVGISRRTSARRRPDRSAERGSSGSFAGSARFQKLVGANSFMPVGKGVTTSSGPIGVVVTGGAGGVTGGVGGTTTGGFGGTTTTGGFGGTTTGGFGGVVTTGGVTGVG